MASDKKESVFKLIGTRQPWPVYCNCASLPTVGLLIWHALAEVTVQVDVRRQVVVSWGCWVVFLCTLFVVNWRSRSMAKQTKNGISARTVRGWINDLDITKTWIETETDSQRESDGHPNVIKIRWKVCSEFRTRLKNVRNFSTAFIDGISGVKKHSTFIMHLHATRTADSVDACLKTTPIGMLAVKQDF